jgi:hypothetical protein
MSACSPGAIPHEQHSGRSMVHFDRCPLVSPLHLKPRPWRPERASTLTPFFMPEICTGAACRPLAVLARWFSSWALRDLGRRIS